MEHIPVLLDEVLTLLAPKEENTVLDCTLGLGGHSSAFCERIGAEGILIGIDADRENLDEAKSRLSGCSAKTEFHHCNFGTMSTLDLPACDIIFADLGVSSPHFDDPERGFSFRENGPLDLRFDRTSGQTAFDLIEASTEQELGKIIADFGELKGSYKIGRVLKEKLPRTTEEVRECIEETDGHRAKQVLPQVFQALRIAVNDELGALQSFLDCAPKLLRPGGRLGIISFHSLEDRIVKHVFKSLSTA